MIAKPYSCRGLAWFLVLFDHWPFEPFPVASVVVLFLLLSYVLLYWFRSFFIARPLVVPEGVRVVLGRLPCPWSVFAVAVASSAC